jgi:hypothetical protein
VRKETVAACVRVGERTGKAEQHVQTFGTTVRDLLVLRDWLAAHGLTRSNPRPDARGHATADFLSSRAGFVPNSVSSIG